MYKRITSYIVVILSPLHFRWDFISKENAVNAKRLVGVLVVFVLTLSAAYSVFAQAAGGMVAGPTIANIGDMLDVEWALKEPTGNDWISMHRADGPDSEVLAWQKATPTVDGEGKGGVLYFKATTAGRFQFRFFRNGQRYMVSNIITVLDHVAEATRVPFGGGPQAQPTVVIDPGGGGVVPPWLSARQSNVDGGVNLSIVCMNLGYPDVTNINNSADGWRCKRDNDLFMLDWDSICRRVYGSNYHGVKISNAIDGWRCVIGGSNVGNSNGNTNPQSNPNPGLPADCSGVLPTRLVVGQQATVTQAGGGHNLRAGEGVSQPVRGSLHAGETVTVIGGPRCADGYQWWQVQHSSGTWWVAEAGGVSYWLQTGAVQVAQPQPQPQAQNDSGCSNTISPRLTVAGMARVTNANNNSPNILRSGPGKGYAQIGTIPMGTQMQVIGGPTCASGYWYWQVQGNGFEGWMAEGDNGTYWIEPVGQQPQVQPTAVPPTFTPVPQAQPTATAVVVQPQQPEAGTGNPCAVAYATDHDSGIVMVEYNLDEPFWQCGIYARTYLLNHYGFDMQNYNGKSCTSAYVKDWIQSAGDCGILVDQKQNTVQVGDLVVWPGKCGIAGNEGHVAVVLVPPSVTNDGKIEVTDANHIDSVTKKPNGKIYDHFTWPLVSCVYFIHTSLAFGGKKPNPQPSGPQPGQPDLMVSTTATSITWSFCIACTSQAWIVFEIPKGKCDLGTCWLGFNLMEIPVMDKHINDSRDKITVHVSAETIQRMINAGSKVDDLASWHLYYTTSK